MWITQINFCGQEVGNKRGFLGLSYSKTRSCIYAQIIHKVVIELSTIIYARAFAFIHLSTYTTTATI